MSLNFSNRTICHGDNLPFLKSMNSNTIDLIATDPPFNKGKEFTSSLNKFQDRWTWNDSVEGALCTALKNKEEENTARVIENSRYIYGDDMGAFLCFMAVRLIECRRILKDTGSIYLHCDPTASHYLKELMDAVFGKENFRNEIVWKRTGSHNGAKRYGPIHDLIFFYTKTDSYFWAYTLQPYEAEYIKKRFNRKDSKGIFALTGLTGPEIRTGDSGKPWRNIDVTSVGRHWVIPVRGLPSWFKKPPNWDKLTTQEKLDILDESDLLVWAKKSMKDGNKIKHPRFKTYFNPNNSGAPLQDIILDIKPVHNTTKERTGYPTQKPLALYERIIKASSNKGDFILDPFCGCATTCMAAERLERKWIGIDLWDKAHECVIQRLHDKTCNVIYRDTPFERTDLK